MYGVVSFLLLGSAMLLGQAAFAAVRMTPQPNWVSDNMQAYALVPYIVTAAAGGLGGIAAWLFGGEWRMQSVVAVTGGADKPVNPGRPPQRPPLKKAA